MPTSYLPIPSMDFLKRDLEARIKVYFEVCTPYGSLPDVYIRVNVFVDLDLAMLSLILLWFCHIGHRKNLL